MRRQYAWQLRLAWTFLVLLLLCGQLVASEPAKLPRALGPFELGMTVERFERLTGATVRRLAEAIESAGASLGSNELSEMSGWKIVGVDGADFIFSTETSNGHLYQISFVPKPRNLEPLKRQYTALYGLPREVDAGEQQNKYQRLYLEWCEQGQTRLVVSYFFSDKRKSNEVTYVMYEDLRLLSKESSKPKSPSSRAECGGWP
jgi:hypothetical protein